MSDSKLRSTIQAFDTWKRQLIDTITRFQKWLEEQKLETTEDTLRFIEAQEALNGDRLTIAFVAEFSRGKTELINALFFSDYQRRLLPSDAGRTTMCPTELFYDREADSAYIRLLPIETRLDDEVSIADYKAEPIHWTSIALDTDSPTQMEEAFREIVCTKKVTAEQARKLGLYFEDAEQDTNTGRDSEHEENIEIPKWRHALISFPHPLLKQGLVILDTPGLNAIGAEPELTLNMLPSAQAVLFVLAADTGVTRSDLDVWQYHVESFRRHRQHKGVAVVLNKIDTLWDGIKQELEISKTLDSQLQKTSLMLGVDPNSIFTVSAQKALLAKIKNDQELLDKSRLPLLEDYLCNEILPARESILRENIVSGIKTLIEECRINLASKLAANEKQLKELRGLSGKNADMIMHLMKKTREEQTTYAKNIESFKSSRLLLKRQAAKMLAALSIESLDVLTNTTRRDMMGSWTTVGLKKGITTFFDGARDIMEQVLEHSEQARRLVKAIYKKFHTEHGLPEIEPKSFSMERFKRRMDMLYEEAESFRKSPITTMTEQSFVVKRFFISLVSQARNVFYKANQAAETWLREVMNPLVRQIKDHKTMMESRIKTLRKISESRDTLDKKISQLESEQAELKAHTQMLEEMYQTLDQPGPVETESAAHCA